MSEPLKPLATARGRTILYAEDDDDMRGQVAESLRSLGYRVDEAADGGQALRFVVKGAADVVVMDVKLPIMDGIEVVRRLRALGGAKRPYVIMMSGHIDARTRQLAFEAGCDQYIVKPFDIDGLGAAIESYFVKRDGR